MAERVRVSVHITVAAGAGVGRIALFRARRRGDDCLVAVFVRELRDGFGLRLAAARAGKGPDAGLRRGRLLGHRAAVPCMAERVHISIHVAVAAGAGVRRVALGRAGRRGHDVFVAMLMRRLSFLLSAACTRPVQVVMSELGKRFLNITVATGTTGHDNIARPFTLSGNGCLLIIVLAGIRLLLSDHDKIRIIRAVIVRRLTVKCDIEQITVCTVRFKGNMLQPQRTQGIQSHAVDHIAVYCTLAQGNRHAFRRAVAAVDNIRIYHDLSVLIQPPGNILNG